MIINLWREREKMAEDGKKIGVDQNELELEHEGQRISIDKLINTLENGNDMHMYDISGLLL